MNTDRDAQRWHAPYAWLGRLARDVVIETEGDRIGSIAEGTPPPSDAHRLKGFTVPGIANTHSHAFQRALRGRASGVDFWAWRQAMYEVADRLDPDTYLALARAAYGEMTLAGVTAVGEFHYLHHGPKGQPYADSNEMGQMLIRAASEAGIRMTLLDACYLRGDFDRDLEGTQLRFSDGGVERWAERVEAMADTDMARVAAAIHSVRAVDFESMNAVSQWASKRNIPLHVHVSEQVAENDRAQAATGRTPTELLNEAGVWEADATAIHATHLTDQDIAVLGAKAHVCLCPTTERDLGDGIGPAARLAEAGARLSVGSDSHAVIDLFEEIRLIELHERLATGRRGFHSPESLLTAATSNGMSSLGWDAGRLEPGALADFVAVDLDSARLAGAVDPVSGLVHSATAADLETVVVGGRVIVEEGQHLTLDVRAELTDALRAIRE